MTTAKRPPGRPASLDKATKLATMKLTPAEHAQFIALGGSRWVKRLIRESSTVNPPP